MTTPTPVVDLFYGLSEVAEKVGEHHDRWLGALVLLLAEELGDRSRVVALAEEAALCITAINDNEPDIAEENP